MTKARHRTEWAKKIEAQRQSGLSITKWCQKHGVNDKTFYKWKRTLKTNDQTITEPPTGWCQVQPKPAATELTVLKLTVNNRITIELQPGFDPQLLRDVLTVLCP